MSNIVLVIGDAGVGKRYIATNLTSATPAPSPSSSSSSSAPNVTLSSSTRSPPHTGIHTFPLTLDTKYYSAAINVLVLPSDHAPFADPNNASLSESCREEFRSSVPQAVILVFSLHRPESFHSLVNSWTEFLEATAPEVMIIVGNEHITEGTPKASQDAISELEHLARDWSIEHQIEYVRMASGDMLPSNGENGRLAVPVNNSSRSANDGNSDDDELDPASEPIGLARIRESLECNPWPDMARKSRKTGGGLSSAQPSLSPASFRPDSDEMQHENDLTEAAAFASMQLAEPSTMTTNGFTESDEKFEEFVGAAAPSSSSSTTSSTSSIAATVSTSSSTQSQPSSSASVPVSFSSSTKVAPRSSSASAFANAFAKAIRVPDENDKSPTKSKPSNTPSTSNTTSTLPNSLESDELDPDDIDGLGAELDNPASIVPTPEAAHLSSDESDRGSGDIGSLDFDKLFERVTAMKKELNQVRPDGTKMSDQERRAKAEENLRILLSSMGMEGELESDGEMEE